MAKPKVPTINKRQSQKFLPLKTALAKSFYLNEPNREAQFVCGFIGVDCSEGARLLREMRAR
ncbi:hypothetical protein DMO16_21440 [Fictibacillus sp. S7]|nr:hypothetical protein DMO16_21440 [Fictibacillus sp. S7]